MGMSRDDTQRRLANTNWRFRTGPQAPVNRKVQGSNPWSGANVLSQDIVLACCKTLCTGHRPPSGW
jgi:hypothetical protein